MSSMLEQHTESLHPHGGYSVLKESKVTTNVFAGREHGERKTDAENKCIKLYSSRRILFLNCVYILLEKNKYIGKYVCVYVMQDNPWSSCLGLTLSYCCLTDPLGGSSALAS